MAAAVAVHHIEGVHDLNRLGLVVVKAALQEEAGPHLHIRRSAGQATGAPLVTDPGLGPGHAGDPDRAPGHKFVDGS